MEFHEVSHQPGWYLIGQKCLQSVYKLGKGVAAGSKLPFKPKLVVVHRNLFARELTHDSITQRLPHLIDQFRLRNPAN